MSLLTHGNHRIAENQRGGRGQSIMGIAEALCIERRSQMSACRETHHGVALPLYHLLGVPCAHHFAHGFDFHQAGNHTADVGESTSYILISRKLWLTCDGFHFGIN